MTSRDAGASGWIDELAAPRSEPARNGRAPDAEAFRRILEAATTVPDHGGLRPWRFVVIAGSGQEQLGTALVEGLQELQGAQLPEAVVAKMRNKAFKAPSAVAVIASPNPDSNVPVWEQVASASCTGYALVLAACSLGFGAVWKSASVLESRSVRRFFALGEHEQVLGWVNIGTPEERERRRPESTTTDLRGLVTFIGEEPGPAAGTAASEAPAG